MSERSERSERFTWTEDDLVIDWRPPPRDRDDDKRPEKERQEGGSGADGREAQM